MRTRTCRRLTVTTILAMLSGVAAHAGTFDLSWFTIDGGGGTSSGGDFELSGTVGQADAGAMAGGDFELIGGFWAVTIPNLCPGDVNGDGLVNITDLGIVLSNFGTPSGATRADGDLTGDGAVNISDLGEVLALFGTSCP